MHVVIDYDFGCNRLICVLWKTKQFEPTEISYQVIFFSKKVKFHDLVLILWLDKEIVTLGMILIKTKTHMPISKTRNTKCHIHFMFGMYMRNQNIKRRSSILDVNMYS